VSNRDFLAFQYLHRHQLVSDLPELDQFRVDGRPVHPQRTVPPAASAANAGREFSGRFHGKMIIVQNLLDRGTWPMGPVHYERLARSHYGDDLDDRLRIYYNERAAHVPASHQPQGGAPVVTTRLIDFEGIVEQAVQDLIHWIEDGTDPPASSMFEVGQDLAIAVPPRARQRGGLQPSVLVTVGGHDHVEVARGEQVTFVAVAETPARGGTIVAARWDWDGTGTFPFEQDGIDGTRAELTFEATHAYLQPGTYYATCRVTSHRDGDVHAIVRRCDNLGRVRVVVR
jgi:hypothetical protein